ncbi:MAG: hypothetical protein J7M38_00600 [Armatimonadetes bacterium]|nr:hypothetical protein [Armatimonadota bacterium]
MPASVRHTIIAIAIALLAAAGARPEGDESAPAGTLIIARAAWPGHDLSHANFYVFADPAMKDLVDVFPSGGAGGAAFLALRPGAYYIMVVVDVNASGRPDAGDAFGWYGVEDLAPSSRPRPLVITDDPGGAITVPILMTRTEDGRLRPLPGAPLGRGTLRGRLTGIGPAPAYVILRSDPEARTVPAALVDPDGSFEITAQGGSYQLLARAVWEDEAGADPAPTWRQLTTEDRPARIAPEQVTDLGELSAGAANEVSDDLPALIVGAVTAPPVPEGAAIYVQVCADAQMHGEITHTRATASGLFVIAIEPATYYLRVIVGDDTVPGPGDLLGFYGVADLLGGDRPRPLSLTPGQVRADVSIPIVARISADGTIATVTAADTTTESGTDK